MHTLIQCCKHCTVITLAVIERIHEYVYECRTTSNGDTRGGAGKPNG